MKHELLSGVGKLTEENQKTDVKVASKAGVVVERELVRTEDGFVGTFEVESRRDEPVFVHVREAVPDELTVEEAAFEPESAPDIGNITGGRVSFRHHVTEDPVEIGYWIVSSDPVTESRWTSPVIEAVMESELTRSTRAPAGTDVPKIEPKPTTGESLAEHPGDAPEGTDSTTTATTDEALDDGGSTGIHTTDSDESAPGEQTEQVSSEKQDDGMGGDTAPRGGSRAELPRSLQIRLDHLSARVQEFSAYTASLSELIDERGTASEIVAELENELDQVGERLDALRVEMETLQTSHDQDVEDIRGSVERIDTALDSVEREIATLETRGRERDGRVDELETDVGSLEERVATNESTVDRLESDLSTLEDRVTSVEATVEQFAETVERLDRRLTDVPDDIETIDEKIEDIEGELESLRSFRTSLAEISNLDG